MNQTSNHGAWIHILSCDRIFINRSLSIIITGICNLSSARRASPYKSGCVCLCVKMMAQFGAEGHYGTSCLGQNECCLTVRKAVQLHVQPVKRK